MKNVSPVQTNGISDWSGCSKILARAFVWYPTARRKFQPKHGEQDRQQSERLKASQQAVVRHTRTLASHEMPHKNTFLPTFFSAFLRCSRVMMGKAPPCPPCPATICPSRSRRSISALQTHSACTCSMHNTAWNYCRCLGAVQVSSKEGKKNACNLLLLGTFTPTHCTRNSQRPEAQAQWQLPAPPNCRGQGLMFFPHIDNTARQML